jgi:uncharacterized membrane protein YdjX (TVP38/TMEM64 family)
MAVANAASCPGDSVAPTLAEFERYDSDGDGVLSHEEFAAFVADRMNGNWRSPLYMQKSLSIQRAIHAVSSIWKHWMLRMQAAVEAAGAWAPFYFLSIYVVSTVLVLPLIGFHTVAGYMYGTFAGALLVSVCQTIAAGTAFLFARYFVRPMAIHFLEGRYGKHYKAIEAAIAVKGAKMVFFIRVSPLLPFSLTNYLLGCTEIGFWQFILGTWIGVLPGTTSYCNIGAAGRSAVEGNQSDMQRILLVVQIAAAIIVTKILSDVATKSLAAAGVSDDSVDKTESGNEDLVGRGPAKRRNGVRKY